jgi:uncharacterized protein YbjT (DUF2867 family)
MSERILVTGSTGKVGGELVKILIRNGKTLRAATRNPSARNKEQSVESIEFDYDRPETFAPALSEIEKVFLVARPGDNHSDKAAEPFIDEAIKARVRLIVNLTAMGVEQDESFALRILEKNIEKSGIPFVHLRPNWFMQNFNCPPMLTEIQAKGTLHLPAADAKLSFIDTRDIAAVGYAALTEERHSNKAYTLTGKEALSHFDVAERLSRVSGKKITYVPVSEEMACSGLTKNGIPLELIDRWADFYRKIRLGLCSPVTADVDILLGRPPILFNQYAGDYAEVWKNYV